MQKFEENWGWIEPKCWTSTSNRCNLCWWHPWRIAQSGREDVGFRRLELGTNCHLPLLCWQTCLEGPKKCEIIDTTDNKLVLRPDSSPCYPMDWATRWMGDDLLILGEFNVANICNLLCRRDHWHSGLFKADLTSMYLFWFCLCFWKHDPQPSMVSSPVPLRLKGHLCTDVLYLKIIASNDEIWRHLHISLLLDLSFFLLQPF